MSDLSKEQPSITRAFSAIELAPMSEDECREFFTRAFGKVGITIQENALELIAKYSGGIPALLHEIGDAAFWTDTDNNIDRQDAIGGIKTAAEEIGRKYFDHLVFEEFRSAARRRLLLKVVRSTQTMLKPIKRKNVLPGLSDRERKDIDNLLRRMEKLNILKKGDERGEYIFLNRLFPVYARMFAAPKADEK